MESIAKVHVQGWQETYGGLVSDEYLDSPTLLQTRQQMWTQLLTTNRQNWTIAVAGSEDENGRQIVGFSSYGPSRQQDLIDEFPIELFTLYTLAEVHGQGTGKLLLDAVLKPGDAMVLWVAENNPRAKSFYKKNGFVADGAKKFGGISDIRMIRKK